MGPIVTYGITCAAAIAVSSCARSGRSALVWASIIIGVNWLLFSMPWIYAPASLAFVAYDLGYPLRQEDTWSLVDLVSLVGIVVICRRLWWSPVLWSVYLVTLAMHAVAWANSLEYIEYRRVLDAALIIQLATLFVVGGGDCADRLYAGWRWVCNLGARSEGVRSERARRPRKVASS